MASLMPMNAVAVAAGNIHSMEQVFAANIE